MIGQSVQEFINKNPKKGRVSKLEPFKDDIFFLKNEGYSQAQILAFLQENGLQVGLTTLKSFIKNRSQTATVLTQKTRPNQAQPSKPAQLEPAVKNDVPPPAKTTVPPPISTENDRHPINTGFKKFNSRKQRDIDDLI